MTLSPDEQRDLGEINRILSHDEELSALANLFAEQPARSAPTVRRHGGHPGTAVAVLAALTAFVAGCLTAAGGEPGQITAGALLVLCSAAIVVAVLVRHRTRIMAQLLRQDDV